MKYPENMSQEAFTVLEKEVRVRIQDALDRRTQRPFSTTGPSEEQNYDGIRFHKKYVDIITLILLCWYSEYFLGFESYILYEVRRYLHKSVIFPELSAMTISKELSLMVFFLPCQKNSTKYLFGTVLNRDRIERVMSGTSLKWILPRRVKLPRRHRGYRDHGTLRPDSKWVESHDISFIELQNSLEQKFQEYLFIEQTLVRAAGEWYLRNKA